MYITGFRWLSDVTTDLLGHEIIEIMNKCGNPIDEYIWHGCEKSESNDSNIILKIPDVPDSIAVQYQDCIIRYLNATTSVKCERENDCVKVIINKIEYEQKRQEIGFTDTNNFLLSICFTCLDNKNLEINFQFCTNDDKSFRMPC